MNRVKCCMIFEHLLQDQTQGMALFRRLLLLAFALVANCQSEDDGRLEGQHQDQSTNSEHLVEHLTDIVDLEGKGLRHIQEHLNDKEFPEDGQFAEDIEAIKKGDDTKGIFYFFELHDYDKNKKLDGLELFVALTDHHEKTKTNQDGGELLEEEVESLVDNLLEEHDLNGDGYIDFVELMNSKPDSLWNKLGRA